MAESNGEQIPEEQQMDQEVQSETPATDEPMETETYVRTDNFDNYLGMGFAEKVAKKLDQIVVDLMNRELTSVGWLACCKRFPLPVFSLVPV